MIYRQEKIIQVMTSSLKVAFSDYPCPYKNYDVYTIHVLIKTMTSSNFINFYIFEKPRKPLNKTPNFYNLAQYQVESQPTI